VLAWLLTHDSCRKKHRAADDRIAQLEHDLAHIVREQADLEDFVSRQSKKVLKRIERDAAGGPAAPVERQVTLPGLDLAAAMRARQGR